MVSFVIFITFLVFLYTIIQPVTVREKGKEYVLDYINLNLIESSTGELTTMVVNVLDPISPPSKTCINLQGILLDEGDPSEEGKIPFEMMNHLSFTSEDQEFTYYAQNSNNLYVDVGSEFSGIITLTYSEEIIKFPYEGEGDCDPHSYPTGYIKISVELFESNMLELNESYYLDYEALKTELAIPKGTEFNFYIYDSQRNEPPIISAENNVPPEGISIFVQETPIQYLNEEGNTMFGFLKVEVW
ncbi:hypothetical protein KAI04_03770 [Candidatus Pacearchaeota archaeon]|nr:hypothetical protein [Candidatus Pacearchaeota archaeon]